MVHFMAVKLRQFHRVSFDGIRGHCASYITVISNRNSGDKIMLQKLPASSLLAVGDWMLKLPAGLLLWCCIVRGAPLRHVPTRRRRHVAYSSTARGEATRVGMWWPAWRMAPSLSDWQYRSCHLSVGRRFKKICKVSDSGLALLPVSGVVGRLQRW